MDEDGDAANDFFLADSDPDISREDFQTSAPRDEGEEDSRGGPSQTSPSLKKPEAEKKKTHSVRACASCALDVSAQPDVPLPALAKDDPPRPDTEVGRWLGWCEDGCATARAARRDGERDAGARRRDDALLEAVVSGLGTGYTALGEDDDPEGAAARSSAETCLAMVARSLLRSICRFRALYTRGVTPGREPAAGAGEETSPFAVAASRRVILVALATPSRAIRDVERVTRKARASRAPPRVLAQRAYGAFLRPAS